MLSALLKDSANQPTGRVSVLEIVILDLLLHEFLSSRFVNL